MRSTIEELYYGNITPSDRSYQRSGQYAHILHLITRNEEELLKTLTAAQKETFDKFKDNTSELEGMTELASFALGFKLGLRLTSEAFISSNPEYNLIHE